MSGTKRAGVRRTDRKDACESESISDSPKPSHVRRLNFGQSLLRLNVVDDDVVGQRGNRLIIGNDVTGIPCTEKSEFVRRWVEAHGRERGCVVHEDSPSTSPVLGSNKRAKKSPVLGHRRKRARRRINGSENGRSREQDSNLCGGVEQPLDSSYENSKENVFNHRSTPVHSRTLDMEASSPVVVKQRSWSWRKRRLWDKGKPLGPAVLNYIDNNMNSVKLSHDLSIGRYSGADCKILTTEKQNMLLRKLEMDMDLDKSEFKVKETIKNFDNSYTTCSPVLGKKTESSIKIETGSSDQTKDLFEDDGDVDNDSDATPSDVIEDIDTQYMLYIKQDQVPSKQSQKDRITLPSLSSQRISEALTPVNEVADGSNRTDVISTLTSLEELELEPIKSLTILDSCKKRKKAKKGSLTEKLQTLISSQVSFIRIWRHQMKQTSKDSSSVRYVTVCIQKCTTHFNRQFSRGFVVDDPFKLLPPNETEEVDPRSGKCFHREVRIMTIPEIVGRIEIKSRGMVQIAPPWKILKDRKLFLHVTYLNKLSGSQKIDAERPRIKRTKRCTIVANEFDCPCISANELLESCEARTGKPNVIEAIFSQ